MPHRTLEDRRAYAHAYAVRLHAAERCTTCRGGPVEPGRVLCEDCRYAPRVDRYDHSERTRLQHEWQPPARRHHSQRPASRVLFTITGPLR